MTERQLLLSFVASLSLAENLGDVSEDIQFLFKKAKVDIEFDDFEDLQEGLAKLGVLTLHGTPLD